MPGATTVNTVHSSQGVEVDNCFLILWANNKGNGQWGLNGQIDYLVSATTRARNTLTIVNIGGPRITDKFSWNELIDAAGAKDGLIRLYVNKKKITEDMLDVKVC